MFGWGAALRAGSTAAARPLVGALDDPDETVRTLAGMFLVKGGRSSLPALREALRQRRHAPQILTMFGDIAAPETLPEIEAFTRDDDPAVARAAAEALEIFRLNRRG